MTTRISRRRLMKTLAAGIGGVSASGWFPAFADQVAADPTRKRHCILLWMSGGPTQTDTWDMKPDHENGGEFEEIQTASPGLRFSEHLPKLAKMSDKLAVLRGLNTNEGDHGRGTYLMRTGHTPMGPVRYPSIGASLASQLGSRDLALPGFVSIGPFRAFNQDAFGAGFLGPRFGPLIVGAADMPGRTSAGGQGFPELKVQSLPLPRRAQDQYHTGSSVASAADVRRGDLVFFMTIAPGPSHVGLALDNARFIHAPSERGEVRIESLSSQYWRRRYVGARRIVEVDDLR